MSVEDRALEWAVLDGYEEFVEKSLQELAAIRDEVASSLGPDAIRATLQHPNGFLVRTLDNSDDGQLRLHIWPTGVETDVTPHSHPWHMASLVLAGAYSEYIPSVRIDEAGEHQLYVSYFSEDRQQVGSKLSGRKFSIDLGELTVYHAGEYHILPAGAFHATPLPQTQPIVTLVRTSRQFYENPSYFESKLNRELQMSKAADREPPSEEQVRAIWRTLEPLLDS